MGAKKETTIAVFYEAMVGFGKKEEKKKTDKTHHFANLLYSFFVVLTALPTNCPFAISLCSAVHKILPQP